MKLIRSMLSGLKRILVSRTLYASVLLAAAVIFFGILQETDGGSPDQISVYYLMNVRYGISAFLPAMAVVTGLPAGLSYREDWKNGYLNGCLSREPAWVYGWSKVIVVWLSAVFVALTAYLLAFGIFSVKYPLVRAEDLENLVWSGEYTLYEGLLFSKVPWLYVLCVSLTEAFGYGFLAVLTLTASAWIRNSFLLLSVPLLFYELTVLADEWIRPPFVMKWNRIMQNGGLFGTIAPGIGICILEILGYFLGLSLLLGVFFTHQVSGMKGGDS